MAKKALTIEVRARNMLARGLKSAGAKLKAFGSSVRRIGRGLALAFAGLATGIVVAMVKAQAFNKQIGQIATLTEMTTRTVAKEVRKMSAEFGMSKEELTTGLYNALSAGVPKENVFSFMKVAAKAAKAGAAEVQVAVEATTRIMDSYGEAAGSATHINDMLFKTVKKGVITYDQLASQIGKVAGIAQKAGIPLEDLLAVIATGSKTVNAEQLFTGIRSVIMSLGKTAKGSALMIEKGLGGALAAVVESTGGTLFGLRSVINEARALPIALAVAGKNAAKFKENLDEVTWSAGSMMKAFKKMDKTNSLDKLSESLKNVMIAIGGGVLETLAPTIERAARAAADFAEKIADWFDNKKVNELQGIIEGIANALEGGGKGQSEIISRMMDVVVAGFAVAAEGAVNLLVKAAPTIGKLLGLAATAVWDVAKPSFGRSDETKQATAEMVDKKFGKAGLMTPAQFSERKKQIKIFAKAHKDEIKNRALEILLEKRLGANIENSGKALTEKQIDLKKKIELLKSEAISNLFVGPKSNFGIGMVDPVANAEKTASDISKIKAGYSDEDFKMMADLIEAEDEKEAKKEALIKKIAALEKKEAQNRLNEINKRIAAAKAISTKPVTGIMGEAKASKDADDQWAKDEEKADKIKEKRARKWGPKAVGQNAKREKAFLDAVNKKREKLDELKGLDKQQIEAMKNPLLQPTKNIATQIIGLRAEIKAIMKGG